MYNKSLTRQSGTLSIIGTTKSIKVVLGEQNVTFRLMQNGKIYMNYGIQTKTCCINFIFYICSTTVGTTQITTQALLYKLCGDYSICFCWNAEPGRNIFIYNDKSCECPHCSLISLCKVHFRAFLYSVQLQPSSCKYSSDQTRKRYTVRIKVGFRLI